MCAALVLSACAQPDPTGQASSAEPADSSFETPAGGSGWEPGVYLPEHCVEVFKATEFYEVGDLGLIENKLVKYISNIDFTTHSSLFIDAGFIAPGSSTPSARNQEVQAATIAIFAVLAGA